MCFNFLLLIYSIKTIGKIVAIMNTHKNIHVDKFSAEHGLGQIHFLGLWLKGTFELMNKQNIADQSDRPVHQIA